MQESDVDPAEEDRLSAEEGKALAWCPICQTAHTLYSQDLSADTKVLARRLACLREGLVERIRRHEVDARDLEQLRVTVRDESQRAHEAEVQVDALADALELQRRFFAGWGMVREHLGVKGTAALDKLEAAAEAALRLAGRP